jgi:hypothetical protein
MQRLDFGDIHSGFTALSYRSSLLAPAEPRVAHGGLLPMAAQ